MEGHIALYKWKCWYVYLPNHVQLLTQEHIAQQPSNLDGLVVLYEQMIPIHFDVSRSKVHLFWYVGVSLTLCNC